MRRGPLIGPTKTACAPGYDRFAIRRCRRWPKVGPPMRPANEVTIKSLNHRGHLILIGGDGGIRTLDRALQPYNGLANRRLQPLGHISARRDRTPLGDICPTVPAIARAPARRARRRRDRTCAPRARRAYRRAAWPGARADVDHGERGGQGAIFERERNRPAVRPPSTPGRRRIDRARNLSRRSPAGAAARCKSDFRQSSKRARTTIPLRRLAPHIGATQPRRREASVSRAG